MADDAGLVATPEHVERAELEANSDPFRGGEDGARLPLRPAPLRAVTVEMPGALHLEVTVDAVVAHPDHQVFSATHHALNDVAGEVDRCKRGNADVTADELSADKRGVEMGGGAVDGIALWHVRVLSL